jgi:hypothetical protein
LTLKFSLGVAFVDATSLGAAVVVANVAAVDVVAGVGVKNVDFLLWRAFVSMIDIFPTLC